MSAPIDCTSSPSVKTLRSLPMASSTRPTTNTSTPGSPHLQRGQLLPSMDLQGRAPRPSPMILRCHESFVVLADARWNSAVNEAYGCPSPPARNRSPDGWPRPSACTSSACGAASKRWRRTRMPSTGRCSGGARPRRAPASESPNGSKHSELLASLNPPLRCGPTTRSTRRLPPLSRTGAFAERRCRSRARSMRRPSGSRRDGGGKIGWCYLEATDRGNAPTFMWATSLVSRTTREAFLHRLKR